MAERYWQDRRFTGQHEWQHRDDQQPGQDFQGGPQGSYGPQGGYGGPGGYGGQQIAGRRGRGPKGYKRSDERIREDICERLSTGEVDAGDVTVEVKDGKVTLQGTVPERRMKHRIEDIADACFGVQDVENNIRVPREQAR